MFTLYAANQSESHVVQVFSISTPTYLDVLLYLSGNLEVVG